MATLGAAWEFLRTFGLAGFSILVAAMAARHWQHRNWVAQQRVIDHEKTYSELKQLFTEFLELANKRVFRSKRLLWALKSTNKSKIDEERLLYDGVVQDWNIATLSFKIRFIRILPNGTHIDAEINDTITIPFVEIGRALERRIRAIDSDLVFKQLADSDFVKISGDIAKIESSIFTISRGVYKTLQELNADRLDVDGLSQELLDQRRYMDVPVSYLIRALFISRTTRKSFS